MEENQKKKFICKFCNKRFVCGKSLGGHIRIHLNGNGNSAEVVEHEANKLIDATSKESVFDDNKVNESIIINNSSSNSNSSKRDSGLATAAAAASAFGGQSSYALRENPKKTNKFRVDSSNTDVVLDKICKECGKGFQSLKALCGHMACHSKANNNNNATRSFDDFSDSSHQEKLKDIIFDGQSDTETSVPGKLRRSRRVKYKTVVDYSNESCSDVEQEQQEVAMSLMMLSKDSRFKGGFSCAADSSDNTSGVEAKSSSTKITISVKNGTDCIHNGNGSMEMKNDSHSENSGSGYFTFGPKKSDLDEFSKHKVEQGSRFDDEESDDLLGTRLSRFRRIRTELGKKLVDVNGSNQPDEKVSAMWDSRKRHKIDSQNAEFTIINDQIRGAKAKGLALVENRENFRKTRGYSDSLGDSVENSIDADYVPSLNSAKVNQLCNGKKPIIQQNSLEKKLGSKKGKVHECPFCPKVFKSGQALGGHKRSHFIGGGEDRTVVIKHEGPGIPMPTLIDLNLPAPMDESAVDGFGQWQ